MLKRARLFIGKPNQHNVMLMTQALFILVTYLGIQKVLIGAVEVRLILAVLSAVVFYSQAMSREKRIEMHATPKRGNKPGKRRLQDRFFVQHLPYQVDHLPLFTAIASTKKAASVRTKLPSRYTGARHLELFAAVGALFSNASAATETHTRRAAIYLVRNTGDEVLFALRALARHGRSVGVKALATAINIRLIWFHQEFFAAVQTYALGQRFFGATVGAAYTAKQYAGITRECLEFLAARLAYTFGLWCINTAPASASARAEPTIRLCVFNLEFLAAVITYLNDAWSTVIGHMASQNNPAKSGAALLSRHRGDLAGYEQRQYAVSHKKNTRTATAMPRHLYYTIDCQGLGA